MSDEQTANPTQGADADDHAYDSTPVQGAGQGQQQQETPAGPASPAEPAASESDVDAVYEQAFEQFLGPDAPEDPEQAPPPTQDATATQQADQGGEGEQETGEQETPAQDTQHEPPQLTDEQQQLAKRWHVTPEMLAQWSPEQRQQFLDNAAKRERDTAEYVRQLQEQAKGEGEAGDGGGEGEQQTGEQETPAELVSEAKQAVEDLVDVYGDEIKPLGDLVQKLAGKVEQLGQIEQRVQQVQQQSRTPNQLLVEMTIDQGMRDLQGDFPSLEKAEARDRVIKRFTGLWKQDDSPYRTGEGRLLDRVKNALRDAASAEFSQTTESAAQVALANKTKERLRQQPRAGAAKGRKPPQSEDDVYDQAFEEHLASEFR